MTALRKTRFVEEAPVVVAATARAPKFYVVPRTAPAEAAAKPAGGTLKNLALFFAAPFLGLAYIIALPLVGIAVLTVLVVRAAGKVPALRTAGLAFKTVGLALAAPFIGLAYVVFFPIVCLGLLAWTGGRAALGTGMR